MVSQWKTLDSTKRSETSAEAADIMQCDCTEFENYNFAPHVKANVPINKLIDSQSSIRDQRQRLNAGSGLAILILAGTLLSVILLGSVNLFAKGYLSATALLIVQILNPLCVILMPWFFEKSVLRRSVS
jgi:hypothetical protein